MEKISQTKNFFFEKKNPKIRNNIGKKQNIICLCLVDIYVYTYYILTKSPNDSKKLLVTY